MANKNFVVQNGLTIGPLTIDAATGSITTTGNLSVAGFTANISQDTVTTNEVITGNLSAGNVFSTGNISTAGLTGNVIGYNNFTTTLQARLLANSIIFGI